MILTLEDFAIIGGMVVVLLTPVYTLTWTHVGLIAEQTTISKLMMARLDMLEISHKRLHNGN